MKIATWNVNSIKARKEHALNWLKSAQPDIAFFQELKTDGEHYPEDEIKALGYVSEIKGQKGYAGVATLVREGLEYSLISKDLFKEDEQARYLEIECAGITYINIYAPNGNPQPSEKYDFKLNWYKALEDKLESYMQAEKPVVIGGDFNIIPEEKDCYDPAVWENDALFTDAVRRIYRRLCHMGYHDAFRMFDARAEQYSFWDYQAGAWPRNMGIRIDHFLLSPSIADRVTSCTIDAEPRGWDKPSDHTPVIVTL